MLTFHCVPFSETLHSNCHYRVPVGCMIAGILMEWLGRLNTIKLAAIPCCVGWILMATATNVYMLLAGRILTGLGSAIGTSPAIVYITEVARPDLRGSLISTSPTLASFGMVVAYAEGAFLSWRLVSWLNIIYTIVPIILIQIFVPESPVWLVSKGRIEDAARSLKYLYKAYPQPEHTVSGIFNSNKNDINSNKLLLFPCSRKAWLTCIWLRCKGNTKRIWLAK